MKFAIIGGGGGHYKYALSAARNDPALTLCGLAPGADEKIAGLEKGVKAAGFDIPSYSTWQELLEKEQPDIAVVCPEYYMLSPLSCALLERGVHVFGEKPCSTTMEGLNSLMEAERQGKAKYLSMFTYYYEAPFKKAYDLIKAGAVGEIRLISAQKSYKFGNARPEFYKNKEKYGGTILWVGIHAVNWIHWFTGLAFKSVFARSTTAANRGYGSLDMTDTISYRLENDVLATVTVDYLNHPNHPLHGDDRIHVAGTNGTLDIINRKVILCNDAHCGEIPYEEPDLNIFAEYVRSIQGQEIRFSAADCFTISKAALQAEKSAAENKEIFW